MKRIIIIGLLLTSCSFPELKKLNTESKKDLDTIIKDLKLEKFDYGVYDKTIDGKQRNYFKVSMHDIDDSVDFEPYNARIIKVFNKSGYNLKQYDFVVFYYYKDYFKAKLYKFYKIRASDGKILEEANE
jgi:hypothetical protein